MDAGHRSGRWPILGESAQIRRLREQIEMVAATDTPVLIVGETGVGKELVAEAIHRSSSRPYRRLVNINCTTIPRELFESELFGHVRGAFSGALTDRLGRFEIADGGTLFLDEIGELSLDMQPKLLRVLEEGEFERLGDSRTRRVEARLIAATNRDLRAMVKTYQFRSDLYYRLSVFPIEVPPLRERNVDIPLLARHFLYETCQRLKRNGLEFSGSQVMEIERYHWPGNVRELRNVIERSVIESRKERLELDLRSENPPEADASATAIADTGSGVVKDAEMQRRSRDNVATALKSCNGKIYGPNGAAALLGMRPTTLCSRIKKLKLN